MTQMDFDTALVFGQDAEDRVKYHLKNYTDYETGPSNHTNSHDFMLYRGTDKWLVEVKCEDRYANSPNMCIETYQGLPRKASGLMVTESDVMVHTFGDMVVLYDRKAMYLDTADDIEKDFPGADNYNGGYVLPRARFKKHKWYDSIKLERIADSYIWG